MVAYDSATLNDIEGQVGAFCDHYLISLQCHIGIDPASYRSAKYSHMGEAQAMALVSSSGNEPRQYFAIFADELDSFEDFSNSELRNLNPILWPWEKWPVDTSSDVCLVAIG
jgi:hypothetical protein